MPETIHPSILHDLNVRSEILPFIQDGSKTLEIRVASGRFLKINQGDLIRFNNLPQCIKQVTEVGQYSNFDDLLANNNPDDIMPGMPENTILDILRTIYSPEKEAQGVLAFRLEDPNQQI